MKAKLTFGRLSFEWETPENDVGVVLRQLLSAINEPQEVSATPHESTVTAEVPAAETQSDEEPTTEEETQPPIDEQPEPEHPQTIQPEPTEREPLGKAIARLQKEKKSRNASNAQAVVLKKDGDTKWFASMFEASLWLDCAISSLSKAAKYQGTVKGWSVEKDNPTTPL